MGSCAWSSQSQSVSHAHIGLLDQFKISTRIHVPFMLGPCTEYFSHKKQAGIFCIKFMGAIHSTKIQTGLTGRSGPPQKVDQFFRNFSGWTEPIH